MPLNASTSGTSGRQRNSLSQKTSRKRALNDSQESEEVQSVDIAYLANSVVRYVVIVGGSNIPIKRTDIIKNCFAGNASVNAKAIFNKAKIILKNVYGYEFWEYETKHVKIYVLKNTLQSLEEEHFQLIPADYDKVLKFLVLSHIFMSGESSTDGSLFTFLQCCKIDPHILHPIYGNIKDFINAKMTKEKLIIINVNDESRKVNYIWGPNADLSVSKMEILKFFASFGNRNIKSWGVQYKDAKEQLEETENSDEENV